MAWILVLVAAGCGGSAPPPALSRSAPSTPTPTCAILYASYEGAWRLALEDEMSQLAVDADAVAEIVALEVETLPHRDELAKMRSIYAVVEAFLPDAPWSRAFTATDAAIEVCGEGAHRPVAWVHQAGARLARTNRRSQNAPSPSAASPTTIPAMAHARSLA